MGFRHALPLMLAAFSIVYAKPVPVPEVLVGADGSIYTTTSEYVFTSEVVYTSFKTIVWTNSDGRVTSKCSWGQSNSSNELTS